MLAVVEKANTRRELICIGSYVLREAKRSKEAKISPIEGEIS